MERDNADSHETEIQSFLKRKMNRRRAISTGGKVALSAGIAAIVAGAGGYYGGTSSAPPRTAQTVTTTVTSPGGGGATQTVTQTQTVSASGAVMSTADIAVEAAKKNFSDAKITLVCESGFDEKEFGSWATTWKSLTGMTVEILPQPTFAIETKTIAEGLAKSGAVDMLTTFPMWYPDLVDGGTIRPVDDFIAKYNPDLTDFTALDFYTYHNERTNHRYGLPIDGDNFILYYRKDWFESDDEKAAFKQKFARPLTVPNTWQEFHDVTSFLKRAKGENLAGVTLDKDIGGHLEFRAKGGVWWWFLNRAASYGVRYFRKTESDLIPAIDSPAAVQALKDMMQDTQYGIPAAASVSWGEVLGSFEAGDAAMNIFWPMLGKHAQFFKGSVLVDKLGYSVMPGTKLGDGVSRRSMWAAGKALSVTTDSRNPEAAYLFMQWMTSPEIILQVASWHQPEALGALDPIRARTFNSGAFERVYGDTWKSSGEYLVADHLNLLIGFPDLQILGTPEYYDALDSEISNAIIGKTSPEDALHNAADKWNQITDKHGRKKQWSYYDPSIYELGQVR